MPPMPPRPGLRNALRVLGRREPQRRGSLRVEGLRGEVTVARDRWGIPHVTAASDDDAWFGLGFCHGQDRAFQLEMLLRAGRGTLSELLGSATLPIDRLSRTLGFRRVAARQLETVDADVRATLSTYVAGINAAARAGPRPHELVLLRAGRSPWEPTDVLAFQGLQSLSLAGNWDAELGRLAILEADGPDALAAVLPSYAEWLAVTSPPGAQAGPAVERLAADVATLQGLVGGAGASNAWAVAASRSATGAPILANDPHLAPDIPAPWYLAHLRTPEWEVAGASFVGGPAFPSGHNGHAAWGITAGCTDSADLFWEEITGDVARGPDGPQPITRTVETIVVRGAEPVSFEIVVTARGPVVTPILDRAGAALSLSATWLQPAPVRGLLDVTRARDFETFRSAFAAWPGPSLNVAYADRDGHIGWQLAGTLPRRRAGSGLLPSPAWAGGWDGPLPFDDMPHLVDPASGYVVTANNAPRADSADAPYLGSDWLDGYRAMAIGECLDARSDWDVAGMQELQVDVTSIPWREMRDLILAVPDEGSDGAGLALALLRTWDGRISAGSPAASVFELLVAELAASVARDGAPNSWRWALGGGVSEVFTSTSLAARHASRLVAALRDGTDRSEAIRTALATAVATLTRERGPDPRAWAWGRVRPMRLRHALGVARPLDRLLNVGPLEVGGDANTVAQAGAHPLWPMRNPRAIANHRMVIDLGDVERSRFVVAGGQSGNPLSPHYRDLVDPWLAGQGVPIAWSSAAVDAATVDRLELRPAVTAATTRG